MAGILEVSLSCISVANLEMHRYIWKVQWCFFFCCCCLLFGPEDGRALWERTYPKGRENRNQTGTEDNGLWKKGR